MPAPISAEKTIAKIIAETVISIDVGIKNLAICVLRKAGDNVQVLFWRWYDVTTMAAEAPIKKIAAKKKPGKGDAMEACIARLRKNGKACGKQGTLGKNGKAFCGVHDPARKHRPEDTQQWCYDLLSALPKIAEDMGYTADDVPEGLSVAIEQQSSQNRKMMLQGHIIYGFFVQHFQNTVPVHFVPAYNKLLVYGGPEIPCSLKTPYAKRKFLARKHTEYILTEKEHHSTWLEFFHACKGKQDDVSDAFLQGMYLLVGKSAKNRSDQPPPAARRRRRRF